MEHGKEEEGGAELGQEECKKPQKDEQVEAEAGPSQASKRHDQAQLAASAAVTAQQQSGQNASLSHPELQPAAPATTAATSRAPRNVREAARAHLLHDTPYQISLAGSRWVLPGMQASECEVAVAPLPPGGAAAAAAPAAPPEHAGRRAKKGCSLPVFS
jgi:hypothetical protein